MKKGFIQIASICVINFVLNYLLLFPLGLFKYLDTPDLKMFGLMGVVVSGIPALTTILFYKLVDRKPVRSIGFTLVRKDFLFSVAAILTTLTIFALVVVFAANQGIISPELNMEAFSKLDFYLSFLLVMVSWLAAAFYEEFLFRGYFVANLNFLSTKKLYVMTSLIFMIFHIFKGYDLLSNIILMGMSCVFLTIYLKSGSLLPSTFTHFIFNFTNTHLIGNSDIAILKYSGDLGIYNLISIIAFSLCMIILTKIFYRKKTGKVITNRQVYSS
ncbi:CPBP family intramembrane glutamic endopeptidase [Neobacillus muris]|uniref:CPBP family intramembrane glutamic endopeptidase n=1 Tax=Neobacillus muris TaxID=2941334 RepID=UPI00203ACD09|nr:type II CAAX endopeptidase family protein [Neobacillus muris]